MQARHVPLPLRVAQTDYLMVDLKACLGDRLSSLPYVLRLLLENALRNAEPDDPDAVQALAGWLETGSSAASLAFRPLRLLMEDTTSIPVFVDVAAMRDVIAEAGGDPAVLNPVVPIDASMDHSISVDHFGRPDAWMLNQRLEQDRHRERFAFLRWVGEEMQGVRIHPPGTGIMHTLNAEQLTPVAGPVSHRGQAWLAPDFVVGTDSHMPLVNGLGVLAWGIGGLEAQAAMFGEAMTLRIPDVIGVELRGELAPGILATDLALEVTARLRALHVSGEFVEFFGPGVSTLDAGQRCVVASMAPEYGATTGFFPADAMTLAYLRATGRAESAIDIAANYLKAAGLWFDPQATPRYSRCVTIDLAAIRRRVAGPARPQDMLDVAQMGQALEALEPSPRGAAGLPAYPIAIAAVTSCTNTTALAMLVAAGLVARKARQRGLRVPAWVKTSLAPGSPAAQQVLARAGLLDDLSALGFDIVGFGCTTCIGNAGPLTQPIEQALGDGLVRPVAVLSGNRNFPGRVHPELDLSFIMSPPLVIAYGLCGNAQVDLDRTALQVDAQGEPVFLRDLWPAAQEIDACLRAADDPGVFSRAFKAAAGRSGWDRLAHPCGPRFSWDDASTMLRRPPYVALSDGWQPGRVNAYPLLVLGDDVTTDHITPGSAIPPQGFVADYLAGQGLARDRLGAFSARRGNWKVMQRATFYSKALKNLLQSDCPVGHTLHVPSMTVMPIFEAASQYRQAGDSVVIVAGARYGAGSSRDWAAKGPWLLGVRAVLAISFERIHRSNLIGMGIFPLQLPAAMHPLALDIKAGERIEIDIVEASFQPRSPVRVRLVRRDGACLEFMAQAAIDTEREAGLLKGGGMISHILRRALGQAA